MQELNINSITSPVVRDGLRNDGKSELQIRWVLRIYSHNMKYYFNGLNICGTMKIHLRQGQFELMSISYGPRSESIIGIFSIFLNMKAYCVFSLESPH